MLGAVARGPAQPLDACDGGTGAVTGLPLAVTGGAPEPGPGAPPPDEPEPLPGPAAVVEPGPEPAEPDDVEPDDAEDAATKEKLSGWAFCEAYLTGSPSTEIWSVAGFPARNQSWPAVDGSTCVCPGSTTPT
jgi:hypothetical protein